MTIWQNQDNKLFDKIACCTDLHFGRQNNDRQANQDNEDFITWFIDEAKAFGATQMCFLGDWHENRHNIHVSTMNYSLSNMERLSKAFDKVWFIPGNHDLFFRDKREINSIEFARNLPNVEIIHHPLTISNCTFLPWLVGEEWKDVPNIKSKYVFGHFELPSFFMNGMTEMPDHGGLNKGHFVHQDYVFSGHFHKRQAIHNVIYIGNPFPTSYSDVWDDDRGMMLLEWNKEPEFKEWPQAPKYRTMKFSEMVENPHEFMLPRSYNRASIDLDVTYEEAQFVRDVFTKHFKARKIELVPIHKSEEDQEFDDNVIFQSVDQTVETGLNSVESTGIDVNMLVEIYRGLQ